MELNKRLIVDLDDTISITTKGDYLNSTPIKRTVDLLKKYKDDGFEIVINTSRNMRTFEANIGKINIYTLPNIIDWLKKTRCPF